MPFLTMFDHKIYYSLTGSGPLLIILPGNTASSICHQDDINYFSQNFTVAAIDYLGVGNSDRIPHFGLDWFKSCADQTAELIKFLGRSSAILLGTSGGAVIALQTAARFPQLVRAVVADSFTPIFTQEMLQRNVVQGRAGRSEEQTAFWQSAHGDDWEKVIELDTAMLIELVHHGGRWLGDSLQNIQCPVLVTVSLEDQALIEPSEFALEILDQLAMGYLFISKIGEHPLMWSQKEVFRAAVKGFLESY